MQALMMNTPLLITSIMRHANNQHGNREVVSYTNDNPRHRYTYSDAFSRAGKLANALKSLGLTASDRVASLAWNDYRHLELYYGVSCAGYVLHTVNPRLFPDQIAYVLNHAEDQYVFVDTLVVPVLEQIQEEITGVRGFIVLTDDANMPATTLPNVRSYESLIAGQSEDFDWPDLDENTACSLCYTSGTTGEPKGVLYSHRSTVLHAYSLAMADTMGLSARDAILPVVPMFHVNAWGTAYAGPMVGAKMILPGAKAGDPKTLHELMDEESVTIALGVPTVWAGLLQFLALEDKTLHSLERTVVGGAACPASMIDEFSLKHNVVVHHAWGMTETSPLGTYNSITPETEGLPEEERKIIGTKQGRTVFGVEIKITDDNDAELPCDGKQFGSLMIRGPWVARGYYQADESTYLNPGEWFETGDVATIDPYGFMQITDRTKDIIKSGGEWISSIELENLAVAHPGVVEAAVISIKHSKWGERPLLIVVPESALGVSAEDILGSLKGNVADWWLPDDIVFVDQLPHTATGKISKLQLREQFSNFKLSS